MTIKQEPKFDRDNLHAEELMLRQKKNVNREDLLPYQVNIKQEPNNDSDLEQTGTELTIKKEPDIVQSTYCKFFHSKL